MLRGRKLAPLVFSDEQSEQLLSWTRSASMPHGLVLRARIVLASADAPTNTAVAQATRYLAAHCRQVAQPRILALGVLGLHAKPARSGN